MARAHDRPSALLAEASETSAVAAVGTFDPLSDVLRTVRLKGALFFVIEASSPWCDEVPAGSEIAPIIQPGTRHVVSYHVIVEGRGLARVRGGEAVAFQAGDVLVIPHGDAYAMSSAPGVAPQLDRKQTLQFFRDCVSGRLPFVIEEGGGGPVRTTVVCGFLGCDLSPFNPLFAALPSILTIHRPAVAEADLLDRLIELALAEVQTVRVGGDGIRLGLCELMFVELLRRYAESLTASSPGWLAALRDPAVGRVVALIHADPARDWTLHALARAAGLSRSLLAERFGSAVGETPMRYLKLWRMQLAARLLADGAPKVAAVGEQVGFRSEAAFSRTFKRVTGLAPSEWRRAAQRKS